MGRVTSRDGTTIVMRPGFRGRSVILAHGGASFAQSLIATGLIDEYQLLMHPVALGHGLPIFSELPMPPDLNLVESTRFPSGAVANLFRTA